MNPFRIGDLLTVQYVDDSLKGDKATEAGVGIPRAALVTSVDDDGTPTCRIFVSEGDDEIAQVYEAQHQEDDDVRERVVQGYVYQPR